jgi:hypothetical protein
LQLILGSRGVAGRGRNYVAIEETARKGDSYLTLLSAGRAETSWQQKSLQEEAETTLQ